MEFKFSTAAPSVSPAKSSGGYRIGMSKAQVSQWTTMGLNDGTIMRGVVDQKQSPITKEIGEDHPFDYEITTGLYLKFSYITGSVDKIVDYLWGTGFSTKSMDKRCKDIIDQWLEDVRFKVNGRPWVKQALIKGFSPLELAGTKAQVPGKIKTLNANRVYIKRDSKGEVIQYNQIKPGKTASKDNLIPFDPYQIAALHVNKLDDMAYGYGIIYPQRKAAEYTIQAEADMHKLLRRKANVPIVVYMGNAANGDVPTEEATNDMADKLTFMNNQTEWVFSADMKAEVLDFGDIGKKFETVLDHDKQMLRYGLQVPQVLMGDGSIPEGLAAVQAEAFDRYILSLRVEIEAIIEDQIFKRVLLANNLQGKVEFIWGEMSKSDRDQLIVQLTTLLGNQSIGPKFRMELEKKLAGCFDIDPEIIEEDAEEREKEADEPQPKVPGGNQPGKNQSLQVQLEFVEGELIL